MTKYDHFVPLTHSFTALTVAQEYLNNIYKLHGIPESIVSDRDKIFLSQFWRELFKHMGTKLKRSTPYHPQTDGQTEILNKCLEGYLRCMVGEKPSAWVSWLSLAEWWYNTTYHSAIQTTPYEALYGQPPPLHLPYVTGASPVASVNRTLQQREVMRQALKFHLTRAQDRMKQMADKKQTEREFKVGDLVYLKLQPYRQHSLRRFRNQKLAPRYFRPFPMEARVGHVAYRLALPPSARIHHTFHVSQLKKHIGSAVSAPYLTTNWFGWRPS